MIRIIKENLEDDFNEFDLGDNNAEWYDGGKNIPKECIKGATLLLSEEYQKYKNNVPKINDWWWLRSAGGYYDQTCYVYHDGDVGCYFYDIYDSGGGIRPALILNLRSSNLKVGDKFEFGEYLFTVISKKLAICDNLIGKGAFRKDYEAEDANDYKKSDVKKVIDDWFDKSYSEYEK